MIQDLSSPEWTILGDTISHMADIPSPSEGAQQGLKEGFEAVRDLFAASDVDHWTTFLKDLSKMSSDIWSRWGRIHREDYIEGYLLALTTSIKLLHTFVPADAYI